MSIRVCIRINATRANQASWGETAYAGCLAQAMRKDHGCETVLLFRGERPGPSRLPSVLLQISGPHLEEPVSGLPNLLWMLSPPNVAPKGMLARYQALFIAARHLTAQYRGLGLDAEYLPQATDTTHFHPSRRPSGSAEIPLVFVGAYASRVSRQIVLDAVRTGFEPQIWGPGWQDVVPRHLWQGERLNHDELADVYARARVVLNSHMASMAALGFMSNRSYDALASGAAVVSDPVLGHTGAELPEVRQVNSPAALARTLKTLLEGPAPDAEARLALHGRMVAQHDFSQRALVILARARRALAAGEVARPAFGAGLPGPDPGPETGAAPVVTDEVVSALLAAARDIAMVARHLDQAAPSALPDPAPASPLINGLSADVHEIRDIARGGNPAAQSARLETIAARARRLAEAVEDQTSPLCLRTNPTEQELILARVMTNTPLWAHAPTDFDRGRGKTGLPLPQRKLPSVPKRPVGVFLHLYYDDLAPVFAERLRRIAVPLSLYVSTDTAEKAARIRDHLPGAEIRVFANRGRDIWPKLYGFASAYAAHDLVLHLHGKRSPHSDRLDDWLAHILDCLVGSGAEVNRILSFFEKIPTLGMVVPITFRAVLGAAHWGCNRDIARELARRMALPGASPDALPDDNSLRFPVGSMFWARSAAIRPLLDLGLGQEAFAPEAGQVDATLAHAIERMLGVTCRATGHHILPVLGAGSRLHRRHQVPFTSNRDLRSALESGVFDG
ncbi:rhamnan synthesis F family protein [Pseudogemmobacter bohemicus]|uniref:rhamnan synthesis F family protein n=1 Tax=Pseudogemmobacter bohemicus TaxID=2250708 RepID=UPI001E4EBAA6|nr:rhamnan synthesis F family protein [Pseudogemmobacter bohemicus]